MTAECRRAEEPLDGDPLDVELLDFQVHGGSLREGLTWNWSLESIQAGLSPLGSGFLSGIPAMNRHRPYGVPFPCIGQGWSRVTPRDHSSED